jgi:hypothetical protein
MTMRGSTDNGRRGFVHFTNVRGFWVNMPVLQAYSIALFRTMRLRLAVFSAAGLPSLVWLILVSAARASLAAVVRSLNAAIAIVLVRNQSKVGSRSLGGLPPSLMRSL